MKKVSIISLIISTISLLGVLTLILFSFSTPKIAYVETDKLLNEYQGMIEAKAAFQVKANQWQANIDTLKSELETAIKTYEAEKNALSQKIQQEREKELGLKQQQLAQYNQSISQQAEQEDEKLTEGVVTQVNAYIKEYGKDSGYKIILGANGSGSIVYGEDAMNITEDVLEGLNEEYDGK
jgi:outer membrane protein